MKRRGVSGFAAIVMFAIVGIVFTLSSIKNLKFIFTGKAADLNEVLELDDTPKIGTAVGLDVRFVLDWYAELHERGARGSRNITYHCMVLLDDGRVISLSVKKGDKYDKIDRLIDESYDFLTGERSEVPTPVHIDGAIRKINSEIKQYYYTGLTLWQFSPQQDAYMLEVDTTQSRGIMTMLFIIGICSVVGVIIIVVLNVLTDKEKSEAIRTEADEPVTVADNDPIFNKAFYDNKYLYGRVKDTENEDTENDAEKAKEDTCETGDNGEKSADGIEATEKKSKFSLKKDED